MVDDIIFLVSESPEAHGIFDAHAETLTTTMCQVRSVSQSDYWRAKDNDLNPQYVFRINKIEYGNEKVIVYGTTRYAVVRASIVSQKNVTDNEYIDLTCEPATIDRTFTPLEVNNNG